MTSRRYILLFAVWCCTLLLSCAKPSHEQVQAWYEQGKDLRAQGEPAEAMAVFLQAAHSHTDDEMLLGRVCSNMANICRQANDHHTAYRVYAVSAEHFAAADSLAYAYALNNMAWEQAVMGHKDSALALVSQALFRYPQPPLTDKVVETMAAACFFTQDYDSVLFYTASAGSDYLLMLRAQAYSFVGQDDSATFYARLLLPRMTNLFYLDDLYYILTHNDANADMETLRRLASERADVQKAIEQRYGKLVQAVQMLNDDMGQPQYDWKLLLGTLLMSLVCLAVAVVGVITIRERRELLYDRQRHEHARRNDLELNIRLLRETDDLRGELYWNDFAAFCHQTDKLFHGLAAALEQLGLGEQDIRICVLVLIGLPLRQIADMLPCSQKSIGKLKDVTARKLGVSGGQLHQKLQLLVLNQP